MNTETEPMQHWLESTGKTMLHSIGIRPHHTVLDFGCGQGTYTLPCSQLLGSQGTLYALDKNTTRLEELDKKITQAHLLHIHLINTQTETHLPLQSNTIDFILLYDVLHLIQNRVALLAEFRRILKTQGTLSLYPRHHDTEMHMSIEDIHQDLRTNGFLLTQQHTTTLMHNQKLEQGTIYNYQKKTI